MKHAAIALLSAAMVVSLAAPAPAQSRYRQQVPEPASVDIGGARLAVVSLAHQHVSFYDDAGGMVRSPISSGSSGLDTPVGVYSVLQKKVDHTSNIYDDAKMPFMQRITWSGVALHAGALPGYPASHGCVRLPIGFAEKIFDKTRIGLRVVISHDDVAPSPITHAALLQPQPLSGVSTPVAAIAYDPENDPPMLPDVSGWSSRQAEQARLRVIAAEKSAEAKAAADAAEPLKAPFEQKDAQHKKALKSLKAVEAAKKSAEQRLAAADRALAAAKKPKAIEALTKAREKAVAALAAADAKVQPVAAEVERIGAELATAKAAWDAAEAAMTAAGAAAKEAERKTLPVSVFVSRSTQRLYVRQGHSPVLDVPVEIRDPDMPIGTHVFTALGYSSDGNSARWNVVSLAPSYGSYEDLDEFDDFNRQRKQAPQRLAANAPATDAAAAAQALDRIQIPADLRERLSEHVWPGSSLIISDEPMHKKETNNFTDFVVLLSGYPQGGIKKRPPPPPVYNDYDPWGLFSYKEPQGSRYSQSPYYYKPQRGRPRKNQQPLFSWW